jgi:hypothetical protein
MRFEKSLEVRELTQQVLEEEDSTEKEELEQRPYWREYAWQD